MRDDICTKNLHIEVLGEKDDLYQQIERIRAVK